MPGIKVKSKTALNAVRADRQRFNLDVHRGHFGDMGLGVTQRGARGRLFEIVDIQALYAYARMIDRGMSGERAARIAMKVLEALEKSDGEAREVTVVRLMNGATHVTFDQVIGEVFAGVEVESFETWNMKAIRSYIAGHIEDEVLVGVEDEDDEG